MKLRLLGREVEGNQQWAATRFPFWALVYRLPDGSFQGHVALITGQPFCRLHDADPKALAAALTERANECLRELSEYLEETRKSDGK